MRSGVFGTGSAEERESDGWNVDFSAVGWICGVDEVGSAAVGGGDLRNESV